MTLVVLKKQTKKKEILRDNYFSAIPVYNYTLKHTVAKSLSLGFLYKAHQWFARLVLPPVLNQKGHLPVTSDPDQYVSA